MYIHTEIKSMVYELLRNITTYELLIKLERESYRHKYILHLCDKKENSNTLETYTLTSMIEAFQLYTSEYNANKDCLLEICFNHKYNVDTRYKDSIALQDLISAAVAMNENGVYLSFAVVPHPILDTLVIQIYPKET